MCVCVCVLCVRALTELPVWNFFSVPTTAPDRCAALRALFPLTTVSRCEAPLRARLPILVTSSQSMLPDILTVVLSFVYGHVCNRGWAVWRGFR